MNHDERSTSKLRQVVTSRPDGCVSNQARLALRRAAYGHLKGVTCDVQEGNAVLFGEVPSYHLKQLAQETVKRIDGVSRVENNLVVSSPS